MIFNSSPRALLALTLLTLSTSALADAVASTKLCDQQLTSTPAAPNPPSLAKALIADADNFVNVGRQDGELLILAAGDIDLSRWQIALPDPRIVADIATRWGQRIPPGPPLLSRLLKTVDLAQILDADYHAATNRSSLSSASRALAQYYLLSVPNSRMSPERAVEVLRDLYGGRFHSQRRFHFGDAQDRREQVLVLLDVYRFLEAHCDLAKAANSTRYASLARVVSQVFFNSEAMPKGLLQALASVSATEPAARALLRGQIDYDELLIRIGLGAIDSVTELAHYQTPIRETRELLKVKSARPFLEDLKDLLASSNSRGTDDVLTSLAAQIFVDSDRWAAQSVALAYLHKGLDSHRVDHVLHIFRDSTLGLRIATQLLEESERDADRVKVLFTTLRNHFTTKPNADWILANQTNLRSALRLAARDDVAWANQSAQWLAAAGLSDVWLDLAKDAWTERKFDRVRDLIALAAPKSDEALSRFLKSALSSHEPTPNEYLQTLAELGRLVGPRERRALRRLGESAVADRAVVPRFSFAAQNGLLDAIDPDSTGRRKQEAYRFVLRDQPGFDKSLRKRIEGYVKAGAPAAGQSWMSILSALPPAARREITIRLLDAHAKNADRIATLIAQLDPIDGVRDAVQAFLVKSKFMYAPPRPQYSAFRLFVMKYLNELFPFDLLPVRRREGFSDPQIARMFGGDRLHGFFPQISKNARLERGDMATQLTLAVRSAPAAKGLDNDWMVSAVNEPLSPVAGTVGFAPVTAYGQFNSSFEFSALRPQNDHEATRGIVVQGAYERQGFSFMARMLGRGDAQVEWETRNFNETLDEHLGRAERMNIDPLARRLIVYNWAINSHASLVERIREKAVVIAGRDPRFYELRVQVHNFPNHDVLAQIERFHAKYIGLPGVKRQIADLMTDIRRLLERARPTAATLQENLKAIRATDEGRVALTEAFGNFTDLDPVAQINRLREVRTKWMTISRETNETLGRVDGYTSDRNLSDWAQALIAEQIAKFKTIEFADERARFVRLAKLILDHVQLDDLISVETARELKLSLDHVLFSSNLNPDLAVDTIIGLITNGVDQVHARLARDYGRLDEVVYKIARRPSVGAEPVRFVDGVLRGSNIFQLSHLAEVVRPAREVYNAGRAVGTLRFNPPLDQIGANDVVVFDQMPAQIPPVAAIVTLQSGARLSHLQLLAKSLGIPNVRLGADDSDRLRALNGKMVSVVAGERGSIEIEPFVASKKVVQTAGARVERIAPGDHRIDHALDFDEAAAIEGGNFAGPKAMNLVRLHANQSTHDLVPDGVIVPFGFFAKYAKLTKLRHVIRTLGYVDLDNTYLVAKILAEVRAAIAHVAIPSEMMEDVRAHVRALELRAGRPLGFHVRSDTNFEDLPEFNGAGLNESRPNVAGESEALDQAIRAVWTSAFSERAVLWRSVAARTARVPLAEPSVLIQPTVNATVSGVILSRGGPKMLRGRGRLNADWGIGSVVESHGSAEEIDFATGRPYRTTLSTGVAKPVVDANGGLKAETVAPGRAILSYDQQLGLNAAAIAVDEALGDRPHGWDIEWALTDDGTIRVVQARPAF